MSDLSGLNNLFGSITSKYGRLINFKSMDSDRSGEISLNEFNQAKNRYKVNVEFDYLDRNSDGKITEEEYELLQQNKDMQASVNSLKSQIASDFAGIDSAVIPLVVDEIKEFALSFAADNADIENLVEIFQTELQTFYQDLVGGIDRPSKKLSQALDKAYEAVIEGRTDRLDDKLRRQIFDKLESVGEAYVRAHLDDLNVDDLANYLITYMNTSDSEKMSGAAEELLNKAYSYCEMLDKYEFKELKKDAKAFLTEAVNQGIVITLKGVKIRTTQAIDTALAKFTDGNELRDALKEAIANLSTTPKIEEMILAREEELKAEEEAKAEEERRQQELADKKELENCVTEIEQYKNDVNTVLQVDIVEVDKASKETTVSAIKMLKDKTVGLEYGGILYPALENLENAKENFEKQKKEAKEIENLLNKAKNTTDPKEAQKYRDEAKKLHKNFINAFNSLKSAVAILDDAILRVKQLMQSGDDDPVVDPDPVDQFNPNVETEIYAEKALDEFNSVYNYSSSFVPVNTDPTPAPDPTVDPVDPFNPNVETEIYAEKAFDEIDDGYNHLRFFVPVNTDPMPTPDPTVDPVEPVDPVGPVDPNIDPVTQHYGAIDFDNKGLDLQM